MSHVRRREFITLIGGAVALPFTARARQGERMRRIGVLMPEAENDPETPAWVAAFQQSLEKLGVVSRSQYSDRLSLVLGRG